MKVRITRVKTMLREYNGVFTLLRPYVQRWGTEYGTIIILDEECQRRILRVYNKSQYDYLDEGVTDLGVRYSAPKQVKGADEIVYADVSASVMPIAGLSYSDFVALIR